MTKRTAMGSYILDTDEWNILLDTLDSTDTGALAGMTLPEPAASSEFTDMLREKGLDWIANKSVRDKLAGRLAAEKQPA